MSHSKNIHRDNFINPYKKMNRKKFESILPLLPVEYNKSKVPQDKEWYSLDSIRKTFNLPQSKYVQFKKPIKRELRFAPYYNRKSELWRVDYVFEILNSNSFKKDIIHILEKEKIRRELNAFTPEIEIEKAKTLNRHFFLHVGPTNSGKTHDAIEALKKCKYGAYLGPLRLLALEIFDTLNAENVPCNLLTGEEAINTEGATKVSSTIELCDYSTLYDVAVIDEAQMITDPERGPCWFKAIMGVKADEVHICLAPEALSLIEEFINEIGDPYKIIKHERLVPLTYAGKCKNLSQIKTGDAIIAFSRKNVLNISAQLENIGIKSSVIYGALPPAARREEVRRYTSGETTVVVATDAIGMGINLPIKRVVFAETRKFDGNEYRTLKATEVKQIAGRAGRFGIYDEGQVLEFVDNPPIEAKLYREIPDITQFIVPFPKDILDSDYNIADILKIWESLKDSSHLYKREDLSAAIFLLGKLNKKIIESGDKRFIYDMISCPVNIKNRLLVSYWAECANSLYFNNNLSKPDFSENTLESCELKYQAYDVYHQLLRRIGIEDNCLKEKEELCNKINKFLLDSKAEFVRKCEVCGKLLDINARFNICDRCYYTNTFDWLKK